MLKSKKTIKEEIMNCLYLDQPTDKEREETAEIILDIFRRILQRFIEETRVEKKKDKIDFTDNYIRFWKQGFQSGYNQALQDIIEKQAKWLKENL